MILNDVAQMDAYVEAFKKLAAEEGCDLNEEKLRRTLRRYSFSDIERALDACMRFGLTNMMASL